MFTIAPIYQNGLIAFTRANDVYQLDLLITKLHNKSHTPKAMIMAATRDLDNKTLIHIAVEHNAQDVLGYCLLQARLLEEDPAIYDQLLNNADAAHGTTALLAAAASGDYYAAYDLAKLGANPRLADRSGCHLLHYAVRGGSFALVEELLSGEVFGSNVFSGSSDEESMDVDVDGDGDGDGDGDAAAGCDSLRGFLLDAAARGHYDIVSYLMDHCADHGYDEDDCDYELARELARRNGHEEIVQLFDEWGVTLEGVVIPK